MIAEALRATGWAELYPVETNIIYFTTPGRAAAEVRNTLVDNGVLCNAIGPAAIRMVTSLEIDRKDTEEICRIISRLKI